MAGHSASSDRWQRLWAVFHDAVDRAVDRDPTERGAFLEAACGDDPLLRRELAELLAAHGSDGILDRSLAAADPVRSAFGAGDRLAARFRIVRSVGSGGMGTVYEAVDEELGTVVAVKTLHPEMSRDTEALDRFRREVVLARRVTHSNACRLFDLFYHQDAGRLVAFLTMELLRGETLAERLARSGPLTEADAYPIVEQLTAALAAAHRVGVVHRDLKSANVVLIPPNDAEPTGRVVVTDFGVAALSAAIANASGPDLTRSGQLLGTPAFMAPEQLEGGEVTPATDIYALGLLMYEMVTGEVPFANESPLALAIKRLRDPPLPPRVVRPNLRPEWNAVILRCLERDPADRFQTAEAVVAALQRGSTARVGIPRRQRRRAVVAAVAAAAAVTLAGAATWLAPQVLSDTGAKLDFNERDWVLVADFENRTGEPVLDDTVRFALERELSTSQFVNVIPRERVADALRLMKRPVETSVTGEVAREVCLRDGGVRALVRGRIEKRGTTYVHTVELVEPASAVVVASLAEEAHGQDEIAATMRRLSDRLRTAVGEEVSRIQQTTQQLAQVTTRSLRALQLYSRADAVIAYGGGNAAAEELLKQAVAEDPEFASAYIHLAHAIRNQFRPPEEYLPYATRALELASEASDRERLFVRGGYYAMTGDYGRAFTSYQALVQLYPDHFWGTNNAATTLSFGLLRGEDAVPYFVRVADLRPNDFLVNRRMAFYIAMRGNNLAAARNAINRARALLTPELATGDSAAWLHVLPSHERWLHGDVAGSLEELQRLEHSFDSDPRQLALRYQMMSAYQALGRWRDADRLATEPNLSHLRLITAFLRDDPRLSQRWSTDRLTSVASQPRMEHLGVIVLARAGLVDAATSLASRLESTGGPRSTYAEHEFAAAMAIAHGELALHAGRMPEAISLIQQGTPVQRLMGAPLYFLGAEAVADAWIRQGDPDRAIETLEDAERQRGRTVAGSGAFWLRVVWQLAQVYRQVGRNDDAAKLETELRQLLAVADADHPILVAMERSHAAAYVP